MVYSYDDYGWLSLVDITGRQTEVTPPQETDALKANWTGVEWVLVNYVAPPMPKPYAAPVDPTAWLIDVGSFFDRFGNAKLNVLASQDALVRAIVQDCSNRKWIDLKLQSVSQALDILVGKNITDVTTELKSIIINTPVEASENLVLRKLYF
jgi:hypothetical protein